jgi:D-glycero-D-manno-heptose 1,7-bisphosphate phosphatase
MKKRGRPVNGPAVFIDRDGVINFPPEHRYITGAKEFRFVPGTPQAIRRLNKRKIPVVIVSNQSGVGRGLMTRKQLGDVNTHMLRELRRAGASVRQVYYCVHHPDKGCACRKPKPGMLLKAARRFNIDLKRSYIVGDSEVDILAGRSAGCRQVLVLSGRHSRKSAKHLSVQPDRIAKNLRAAVGWILKEAAL